MAGRGNRRLNEQKKDSVSIYICENSLQIYGEIRFMKNYLCVVWSFTLVNCTLHLDNFFPCVWFLWTTKLNVIHIECNDLRQLIRKFVCLSMYVYRLKWINQRKLAFYHRTNVFIYFGELRRIKCFVVMIRCRLQSDSAVYCQFRCIWWRQN